MSAHEKTPDHFWGDGLELGDSCFNVCLRCCLARRTRFGKTMYGFRRRWVDQAPPCCSYRACKDERPDTEGDVEALVGEGETPTG